jgi:hypothetical protein
MDPSFSRFKYAPLRLEENGIWVVTLSEGTSDDKIVRDIEHVSLDGRPDYEALSYAYDDSSNRTIIPFEGSCLLPGSQSES